MRNEKGRESFITKNGGVGVVEFLESVTRCPSVSSNNSAPLCVGTTSNTIFPLNPPRLRPSAF